MTLLMLALFFMRHQIFDDASDDLAQPIADLSLPEDRKPAPEIVLKTGQDQDIRLSSYRGKVVVLSFWASWCMPCLLELPTFGKLYEQYQDRGLEILAVNVEQDSAAEFTKQFWAQHKIGFTNFTDPKENAAIAFQLETLPATFVIDRQQRVVLSAFGANDWTDQKTLDFILTLLNEP